MATIEAGVEEARKTLGDLVTAAARDRQITVISKNGIPAAVLVPMSCLDACEVLVAGEDQQEDKQGRRSR
jgi:prevent-host-death family protein